MTKVDQISRTWAPVDVSWYATTTRHVVYHATVELDRKRAYHVSGVFYVYSQSDVAFSVHYARLVDKPGARRAPGSVLNRLANIITEHEERTCWTCLRNQYVGDDVNAKCPTCDGVGVLKG